MALPTSLAFLHGMPYDLVYDIMAITCHNDGPRAASKALRPDPEIVWYRFRVWHHGMVWLGSPGPNSSWAGPRVKISK